MDFSEKQLYDKSETDSEYSDDSQDDPNFDVVEEARLTFSNLSLKKKTKTRIIIDRMDEIEDERSDVIEMVMPELNEEDQKSYETIQKIIEGGQVERLKVDQCKIYLRKHGLRLSGKKETLILRIKEHIDIVNGGGEKKYPASSFVLNCKGDACMGDIVMFEQNVYEAFNIASRSANGPPCGTRIVAGRIVKESYGAAKQQHTFTVEVLWSKGEKPLPPLHPLLIKGRNLYRLKTMRQKWEDESERQKMLSEKHTRGGAARLNRETRIKQREMRKVQNSTRATRAGHSNGKQEVAKSEPLLSVPINLSKLQQDLKNNAKVKMHTYTKTCQPEIRSAKPNKIPNIRPEAVRQRQPLNGINCNFGRGEQTIVHPAIFGSSNSLYDGEKYTNYFTKTCQPEILSAKPNKIPNIRPETVRQMQPLNGINCNFGRGEQTIVHPVNFGSSNSLYDGENYTNYFTARSPLRAPHASYYYSSNLNYVKSPTQRLSFKENQGCSTMRNSLHGVGYVQKQACQYYARGRCRFGDRCRYLHELASNK